MLVVWAGLLLVLTSLLVVVKSDDILDNDSTGTKNDYSSKIVYPDDLDHQEEYRSFPPGFQHDPDFHRTHAFPPHPHHHHHYSPQFHNEVLKHDGQGGISRNGKGSFNNASMSIPLDFIKNISEYSVNDLLLNFVEGDIDADFDRPSVRDRFGDEESTPRKASKVPAKATCIPEYRTIKLVNNDDPSVLYIPQCTRIEQCGGCCSHALLSCQPIEKETVAYQVMKTQYTGNKKLKFLGKETILVDKHTKCKCDCIIKEENCNKYQEYKPGECRCTCKNADEEEKCYRNAGKKLWNPTLCACQCRDVLQCSTGYYFDQNDCKCSATPAKRRLATYEIKVYDTAAPPQESPYREGN